MYRVVVLQKSLPEYRVAFFDLLNKKLAEHNISFKLIYGSPYSKSGEDCNKYEWASYKKNKLIKIGSLQLLWQPCLAEIKSADLIIVEQANKLLINYVLLAKKIFYKKKFAFWGHGNNLQSSKFAIFNLLKRIYSNHSSWWFAYTNGVKQFLVGNGYPLHKITVVQNAIDAKKLSSYYESISDEELLRIRDAYELKINERILIYCGAFYKEKRLDFLLNAADNLIKHGHNFKLIMIGEGPDKHLIKSAMISRPWLVYTGPIYNREKASFFKLADIFLIPGAIGLAVLDSFAFETPIVTTNYKFHGPEFEYLKDGYNGVISKDDLKHYSDAVSDLLHDNSKLQKLKKNCKSEIDKYSIETMIDNFVDGVRSALKTA
jgi:glycosyltransferase involved in cell wall biosynthesis